DHRCHANPEHVDMKILCPECEVPLCQACKEHLTSGSLPPLSLANDMFTGYAPKRIYEEKVTVMELICASPCITALICISMEAKHRHQASAMDEVAHMARHQYGARGNALTFPLPWEDILRALQANMDEDADDAVVPRSGAELASVARVLLKTNKQGRTTEEDIKNLIHQATVRRQARIAAWKVVVDLIMDLQRAGHPYFIHISEAKVKAKAEALPVAGVPAEVLTVINELDDSSEKLQPQKAATPRDAMKDFEEAGRIFAAQRPRAAVPEGQNSQDTTQTCKAALKDLTDALTTDTNFPNGYGEEAVPTVPTFEIRTGNELVDQFQPAYFAVAFCFCFQYATAYPDVTNTTKEHLARIEGQITARRSEEAPQIDIHTWAAAMQRRVEAQFRRDWVFGFTLWNYIFRTMVNTQQNAYMYALPNEETGGRTLMKNEDIAKGVMEIQDKLHYGTFTDINGVDKGVNGDFTKLRHVPNLSDGARKVLSNVEARTRNIPGTHEVRKTMRHQTHANRVCYGTSMFLTFSPSERDTAVMLRLARVREEDPALTHDASKTFQSRSMPRLDMDFIRLDPEQLELPNYEQRRAMLSRDPLACADGFHTLVLLTLKHLLGVRCCPRCPDCNATDEPCMNSFGSNATARGGVFGRVDAVYGSIECQKSGTLHGHFQIFIQCFHQFTPLKELIKLQATDRLEMLRRYTAYSAHVTRTVYADPEAWRRDKDEVEAEWPEYQNCLLMLSRPTYQRDASATPAAWKLQYLHEDVEQLQQRKQHHVHLPDGPNGERRPLAHCRDPKDPNKCKSGFPRNKWLTEEALVICPGLADKMGMPCKGKRSMVGLTWGPCND
ncbi:ATP-dependent DNA helicase, partial [Durusdinium trenchii]